MAHIIKMTEVEWNSKAHRVFDLEMNPIRKDAHRMTGQVPIAKRDHVVAGALWTETTFSINLSGSGTAGTPPEVDDILKACGLNYTNSPGTSDTYDITGDFTNDFTAVDINQSIGDGLKIPMTNMAMTATLRCRSGAPAIWTFAGAGNYTEPTEAALSNTLAASAHPQPCKNMTCTVAGDTLIMKEIDIMLNNENNSPNYDMAATQGVAAPNLTDQVPTTSILATHPTLATQNYYSTFTSETKMAINVVIGATAGNICTITGDIYLIDYETVDVDGVLGIRLTGEWSWDGTNDTLLNWVFT